MTPRLPEPLMGWAQTCDSFASLRGALKFNDKTEALAFVRGKGWEVVVTEANEKRIIPHSYLDRFRIVRPEDEERASEGKNIRK